MKKLLLVFGIAAMFSGVYGQTVLFSDDFEVGYANGLSISDVDATWQYWGAGFTVPAKNVDGGGAGGDNWYVSLEQAGTEGFAVVQRVFELTTGESYEYKIWVKPELVGQKGALKLEVIDIADANAVVAGPVKIAGDGSDWEELVVNYTAAANQNYGFRLTKTWGNKPAFFDNVILKCTTCTPTAIGTALSDYIKVYPNPATDVINISSADMDIVEVELLDLTGKTVYKSVSTEMVSVSDLPRGFYLLKLKLGQGETVTKKVMVN